mgnify:CR=1 FL=1
MKKRRFWILMSLLVLGLGCRKADYDLDDPATCNNPFSAIPCIMFEGVGQGLQDVFGASGMPGGEEPTPVQTGPAER